MGETDTQRSTVQGETATSLDSTSYNNRDADDTTAAAPTALSTSHQVYRVSTAFFFVGATVQCAGHKDQQTERRC